MIERMARAVSKANGNDLPWDWYEEDALSALQAMLEPTEAMIEAGMDYDERELNIRLGRPPTVEECQKGEWQAMIQAAIDEQ